MAKKIRAKWVRFDEKSNALDYLRRAGDSINVVESNPDEWKWIVIGLHGALYGFAICVCKGTNSSSVRYKTKKGEEKLISFNEALKRCQNEQLMKMTINSRYLELTEQHSKAITMLKKEFRNEFEHFQPKAWSIEIHGFPQMAMDVLDVIRFLALDTGNYVHLSTSQEKQLKSIVYQGKKTLKQSRLFKEHQELIELEEMKKKRISSPLRKPRKPKSS